jgi:hypothetical protein
MLKSCSKDLPSQLVLERKILFSRMLRKLGLQETTDSNGLKVLSSIEGAEKKMPIEKTKQLLKRLTNTEKKSKDKAKRW